MALTHILFSCEFYAKMQVVLINLLLYSKNSYTEERVVSFLTFIRPEPSHYFFCSEVPLDCYEDQKNTRSKHCLFIFVY